MWMVFGKNIDFSDNYGIIKTDEPRTLDFSGVRGFLVTNMFIVQCSVAYNVHRSEPPLLTFQRP